MEPNTCDGEREIFRSQQEMVEAMKDGSDNSFSYVGACSQSNTPQQAGVLVNDIGAEMGVVCSSGFGDGGYPVYVKRHDFGKWGKRVVEMKIEFVNEFISVSDSDTFNVVSTGSTVGLGVFQAESYGSIL